MSLVDRMQRLDRIKRAIEEEDDTGLTESERNEKTELLATCSLLLNPYNSTHSIIGMLENEHGLSERNAFRRLTDAKFVFGNVFNQDKAMERMKAYQRAELAWSMARERHNVDGMTKANEQMMKIIGTDDPNDLIDPTKMEPSIYKAVVAKDQLKLLEALLAGGSLDIAAMFEKAGLLKDAQVVEEDPEEQRKLTG